MEDRTGLHASLVRICVVDRGASEPSVFTRPQTKFTGTILDSSHALLAILYKKARPMGLPMLFTSADNRFAEWLRFISIRILFVALIAIGVVVTTFLLVNMLPGDPAITWAGPKPTEEQLSKAREYLLLDKPIWQRVFSQTQMILSGDFGISWRTRNAVGSELAQRLPATIELVFASLIFVVAGAYWSAVGWIKNGRNVARSFQLLIATTVAVPPIIIAIILQIVLHQYLGILPLYQRIDPHALLSFQSRSGFLIIDSIIEWRFDILGLAAAHLMIPAATLSISLYPLITYMLVESWRGVKSQGWVIGVAGQGVPLSIARDKMTRRLAFATPLALLGAATATFMSSTIIIEQVFSWQGLGSYAVESILAKDFPALSGVCIVLAITCASANAFVEIIHALIDPRLLRSRLEP